MELWNLPASAEFHGIRYWPVMTFVFHQFQSNFAWLYDETSNLLKSTDYLSNQENSATQNIFPPLRKYSLISWQSLFVTCCGNLLTQNAMHPSIFPVALALTVYYILSSLLLIVVDILLGRRAVKKAKVMHEYKAENVDELTLEVDQIIEILKQVLCCSVICSTLLSTDIIYVDVLLFECCGSLVKSFGCRHIYLLKTI